MPHWAIMRNSYNVITRLDSPIYSNSHSSGIPKFQPSAFTS